MGSDDSGSDAESVVSSVASCVSKASSSASGSEKYITGHTPAAWWRLSFRTIVLACLPLLGILGGYGTMSLAARNGTFDTLQGLIAQPDPKFPGTEDSLLMRYTGVKAVDRQLTILVAFFAPVVDFSNPGVNLFAIWGLGQFGAIWTLMVMESMRMGNKGRVVSYIGVVGFLVQNVTYTITTPLWLFAHLLTSPVAKPFPGTHANSVLLISSLDLKILPISIILSYILPSTLMALPSPEYLTPEAHQRLLAIWQAFPFLTLIIHRTLHTTFSRLSSSFPTDPHTRPPTPQGTSYLHNAKHVYRFVLTLCIVTHLPILILSLFPSSFLPSLSPLDPLSTSPLLDLIAQTPSSIFLPPSLLSPNTKTPNLATGVQGFLQWDIYIGSTAFILWAMLLYRNATAEKAIVDPSSSLPIYRELLAGEKRRGGERGWKGLVMKVLGWGVLGGPVGVVGRLLWERDSIVRLKIKQGL